MSRPASSLSESVCAASEISIRAIVRFAFAGKKFAEQFAAALGRHAAERRRMMIQTRFAKQVDHTAAGAGLGVGGAKNDAGDTRVHDHSGAHRAGFESDIQGCTRQAVVAESG